MNSLLDSAHTWFLESCCHDLDGTLVLYLVEGVKANERQFVEVGDTRLGPYFPVQVLPESRCVRVTFAGVLAFFVYDESFDTEDQQLKKKSEGRFLFQLDGSSFRQFAEARTTVRALRPNPCREFLLWCEDRVIHVLAEQEPVVALDSAAPNLKRERTATWSAK